MGSPILGQIDRANALTLAGLWLGILSITEAIAGHLALAAVALIWAGVADLFDGFVARRSVRSELRSAVGKHLDSLVDACSFGIAPALLLYCGAGRTVLDALVAACYVSAVVLRLAYFDVVGLSEDPRGQTFTGMPVTYAALFVPLYVWMLGRLDGIRAAGAVLSTHVGPTSLTWGRVAWFVLYGLLAAAMVSGRQVRKPRGLWYAVFASLALALSAALGLAGPLSLPR